MKAVLMLRLQLLAAVLIGVDMYLITCMMVAASARKMDHSSPGITRPTPSQSCRPALPYLSSL